jgi:hypothetical protein
MRQTGGAMIEQFFKEHQFTIAALGAMSTLAAVVISLWLRAVSDEIMSTIKRELFPRPAA